MDAHLFHPETSIRRAIIQALGTYATEGLFPGEREPLTAKLLDLYCNDPDSGIHGAAEWTLRKWGQQAKLKEVDAQLMKMKDRGKRKWYLNGQGQTFTVIDGPVEFRMGSPRTEPDRRSDETPHRIVIPRRFAIASKEVTVEQSQRFKKWATDKYSPDQEGAWIYPDWYTAARYCNWLSEQEGLLKDQWCYLPNEDGLYAEGMSIPADFLQRTGYRLPTEGEWEYACRAGTVTSRYYGHSIDLLNAYAWYQANSKVRAWTCGSLFSNDLGLFDMLGNVNEWCQDPGEANGKAKKRLKYDSIYDTTHVYSKTARVRRGGCYLYPPDIIRSAEHSKYTPSLSIVYLGFRPARTYP
jgi:formylglycine-generating enzyme required for sulfatase activity